MYLASVEVVDPHYCKYFGQTLVVKERQVVLECCYWHFHQKKLLEASVPILGAVFQLLKPELMTRLFRLFLKEDQFKGMNKELFLYPTCRNRQPASTSLKRESHKFHLLVYTLDSALLDN